LAEIVRKELSSSSHDFEHIMRVRQLCLLLAKDEPNANLDVLAAAALLHDIGRVREDQDPSGTTTNDRIRIMTDFFKRLREEISGDIAL